MNTSRKNNIAVLFINILSYQKTESKNRNGAAKDESYLKAVFKGCRFLYFTNLKAKKMKNVIRKFLTSRKNKRFENIVLIIGAHGGNGETIFTYDEKKIPKSEIIKMFEDTLNLKDKIITCIFQTCRGGSFGMESSTLPRITNIESPLSQLTIVNVAQPGCRSFRSKENGSLFFQAMYSVFNGKKEKIQRFQEFFNETCTTLKRILPLGYVQQPHFESNYFK